MTFQEIGGSPTEQYSDSGFTARREFLVPWEQRNEFAKTVFGNDAESGSGNLAYPGRNDVFAWKLRFEPFDPSAVSICDLEDPNTDCVHYNGSFAKAIVDYHMQETSDRDDGPIGEEGTSITYRMVIDSVEETIPAEGWNWRSSIGVPVPPDTSLVKRIPTTTHYVTWSNVVTPPWEAISAQQGTVNNAVFLGCTVGTLLFEGAETNKLYRRGSGLEEGPSAFVWAIKYVLREKSVKFKNAVYGWNDFYRIDNGTWETIEQNGATLYGYSNFNSLFQSNVFTG